MASSRPQASRESSSSDDEDDEDEELSMGSDSEQEDACSLPSAHQQSELCRYYNTRGGCRSGSACLFLHLCKYAVRGRCRNGVNCHLTHPGEPRRSSGEPRRSSGEPRRSSGDHRGNRSAQGRKSLSRERTLSDERPYQWQLKDEHGWVDVAHDHILEAQYSLPYISSICIYNTPYGRVKIDFERMRVLKKDLRVRRLDGKKSTWVWFYSSSHGWLSYDRKDSTGQPASPIKSADIEQKYQQNPNSSLKFHINSNQFEIKFKERQQVGKGRRRVRRRPLFQQKLSPRTPVMVVANQHVGVAPAASQSPMWKFEGNSGNWHLFRKENGSSVSSSDIEAQYQINSKGVMNFTVKGKPFQLDFVAMKQVNLTSMQKRDIKRF